MSRSGYQGPKLPKFLLDEVQDSNSKGKHEPSRKDRRKAERQQKKVSKTKEAPRRVKQDLDFHDRYGAARERDNPPVKVTSAPRTATASKPLKSILKPTVKDAPTKTGSGEAALDQTVSGRTKHRLQDDDDEIAALEKKLGIRGKKSKVLEEDGLDWIADGEDSDEDGKRGTKRKRPEDAKWLRDKRFKASAMEVVQSEDVSDDIENGLAYDSEDDDVENPFSEDEIDTDDFDGFESEDEITDESRHLPPKKRKENPYIPPVDGNAAPTAKYIPPSLRAPASEDEETLKQLRRQLQGLLNRLSESNMFSIVQSLEELYSKNARQHVTSTLINLLSNLVADPAVLNDSFLVLHAGFAAAMYKTVGTDFGAHLLERIVDRFDKFYGLDDGKQALNLLAFMCNLYLFQVIGSAIIFDYIRMLLEELSENNTELLLRVIRTCGQPLRQNDPSALKDIVLLLQRSIAKVGEANVSVRTKFMVETINDLKNNRMKAANSSVLAAEQTARMKKALTSVGKSRSFKAAESLSITLADIRDSDKKGKWWLVGASYHDPSKLSNSTVSGNTKETVIDDADAGYASEAELNLNKLAREQGMNTEVRRAIFVTTLSSVDHHHAHMQLVKLHLKNKQQLEIPRVLVHCVKAEDAYNPFYALVAMKFTSEHQKRKAFEFALWDFFRQMSGEEEDDGEEISVRKIVNMAKFSATLVAEGGLRMTVLEKLEFAPRDRNAGMFVEVFLTHVFTQASKPIGKKRLTDAAFEDAMKKIFMQTGSVEVIQGLRHVIETSVAKADLALGKKETRAVEMGCRISQQTLEVAARAVPVANDDENRE